MRRILLAVVAATFFIGFGETSPVRNGLPGISLGPAAAEARTVRRCTTVRGPHGGSVRRCVTTSSRPYYYGPRIYPHLPAGCVRVRINGVTAWNCRGVHYRYSSGGYVIFKP